MTRLRFARPEDLLPPDFVRLTSWDSAWPHPTLLRAVARVYVEPGQLLPPNYSPYTHAVWVPAWALAFVEDIVPFVVSDTLERRKKGALTPQDPANVYVDNVRDMLELLDALPLSEAAERARAAASALVLGGSAAFTALYAAYAVERAS